jgi:hypothetical protein
MDTIRRKQGAELDPIIFEHRVAGVAIDFTAGDWAGATFVLAVAPLSTGTAVSGGGFPKTTGFTALTDGVQVDWATTSELNALTPGPYIIQCRARRNDGRHLDFAPVHLDLDPSLIAP